MTDTNTNDAVRSVLAYFAALGPNRAAFWASFEIYFDEATIWENVGLARTVGRDEAVAFAKLFPIEFDYMTVETLHIAAVGDVVLNERIDRFHAADGTAVATIRVSGSMRIEGNVIREWRDYFDTAGFAAATAVR